ncbi:transposase [Syntrophomonas wolfei]|uniref:Transposase n=2 Tax=Syntrophomonas wolfei subsp. wolfei (strain DSM 2245B / Goettingen) TaxID=335541 RepID=Q0AW49_SYNWW|nr:transposase [Syntrophomonas wolfei]OQC18390.1 MAG: Transposase DDE domain protein [Firmicutes bacterium ADurb.Bin080]ABI67637.1 hypothetical protein Swol_0290 [Syntrophomonas wolfei subsp. wolfei str. Goettingen G311]ABI67653.1 hypothetical protein Swol_0310 [Syntrophomonas wolfei subsp. wolfei str. Goettingen G311]ABI67848.1 hypothetical protein Swol_0514 [Syntrophomonas wolfei subsp. wolfei str. Goettingen G311]ABI68894.1 hypothetical protein Swol_1592 [Syntrophomonas wolfei subsp. wolfei
MFKPNNDHLQGKVFSDFQRFNSVVAKRLKNSWSMVFYEQVFCLIREELFAPLYSLEWGRPNFPINILVGLEIIKHLFDYTDQELLDQYYFNYQVQYALGIENIGEIYLGERTLYNFRERVVRYSKEYPEKEALAFQQFEILTRNFLGLVGLKTDELRIDSTLISPNIKKAGRLSLAHDVLAQAVRAIPVAYRSENLNKVLEDSFKNKLLYQTKNSQLDSRLQAVLDLMSEIYVLSQNHKTIADLEKVKILLRFLNEQANCDENSGRFKAKASKEVSSDSLQSAYDTDATYRDKAGKKESGYTATFTETCNSENDVQIIVDYTVEPNNKSDVEIFQDRMDIIKDNTNASDIYADGGYYGENVINKANSKGIEIQLHYTDMTGKTAPEGQLPAHHFVFNKDMEMVQCPGGQIPSSSKYNSKTKITTSHFPKEVCNNCPHRCNCPLKEQKRDMVVRISKKSILASQVRETVNDPHIKHENISKRAAIEGTNSAIKGCQGAKRLRVRGKIKCTLQIGFKVIGHNFKQIFRALTKQIKKPKIKTKGLLCPNPN